MLSQARRQAYHDLTSLSNRLLFCELAARALAAGERSARPAALLALDLDHFKAVNDTQGHGSGDLVLKIAAERMSAALRATDIVARFGGDEFVALLDGADVDTARDVARKLNQALAEPYPGILIRHGLDRHRLLSAGRQASGSAARAGRRRAVRGQGRRAQPLRNGLVLECDKSDTRRQSGPGARRPVIGPALDRAPAADTGASSDARSATRP